VGLTPDQYGLVFAATSLGIIIGGGFNNSRLSVRGRSAHFSAHDRLSARGSFRNVVARNDAGQPDAVTLVISLLVLGTLAFGLIAPNAMRQCSPCRRLPVRPYVGGAVQMYPRGRQIEGPARTVLARSRQGSGADQALRHLAAINKLDPDFAEKFLAFLIREVTEG